MITCGFCFNMALRILCTDYWLLHIHIHFTNRVLRAAAWSCSTRNSNQYSDSALQIAAVFTVNSFPAGGGYCRLPITHVCLQFGTRPGTTNQVLTWIQNVWDSNRIHEIILWKLIIFEQISRRHKRHVILPSMQSINDALYSIHWCV